ncbi:uncharacterized protein LOC134537894 isoform X3 [Bacillus rossius redtenbacheri]|uniref:uncharacterized protein LOC134537894 isoform X3 n=1 Tax=Bacillus rossius redtenbacheri TaxID=93214 RepID=UPI002FDE2849
MEQKPVVEMEFVKVDSIKEEVEEETPLAGVQPAAVWQEEMEQKPVVEMEFVKVDSIKEEVEEETPLAGVQPAAVWQAGDNPAVETSSLAGASRTRASYSGEGSACLKTECVPEDDTQAETATCGTSLMSDICVSVSTDCKGLHHHQHLCSSSKQDKDAPIIRQEPLEEMEQKPVVEMEFVCVDSIKEEVEEETPLAGVQPAAVWQEEMEQKPVVEMEFVKVDSIKEEVEEETPLAGVQPAAVWQIALDGPNVNLKFLKDFNYMMEKSADNEEDKKLIDVGTCSLHTVHGAYKTGHNKCEWQINNFLRALYYLFKDFPSRRADYTKSSGSTEFPLKMCSIRWVENSKVIERALKMIPHLKKYVAFVQPKRPETKNFSVVEDFLKDSFLEAKLFFLQSVVKEVEPYLISFQSDNPMLPFLYVELYSVARSIQGVY